MTTHEFNYNQIWVYSVVAFTPLKLLYRLKFDDYMIEQRKQMPFDDFWCFA